MRPLLSMATWCGIFAVAVHAVHGHCLLPLPDVDLLGDAVSSPSQSKGVVRRHKFPRDSVLEVSSMWCCMSCSRPVSAWRLLRHILIWWYLLSCQASHAMWWVKFFPPWTGVLSRPSWRISLDWGVCSCIACNNFCCCVFACDAPPNASGYPSRSVAGNLCYIQSYSKLT